MQVVPKDTPAPLPTAPETAESGKRLRKPQSPEQRLAAAEKQAVRRMVAKLKGAKSRAQALELLGKVDPSSPAAPAAAAPPPPPAPVATPEQFAEPARQLWAAINEQGLKGTRYEVHQSQLPVLVDGTAPVMAKYLPRTVATPEGAFAAALLMVFGVPAVKHAVEWWQEQAEKKAGAAAAAEPAESPAP